MPLVRRWESAYEAFGKCEKFLGLGDLPRGLFWCDRRASSPIIAGVANLHPPNQVPVKLGRHHAGLHKVLSEGCMHATVP